MPGSAMGDSGTAAAPPMAAKLRALAREHGPGFHGIPLPAAGS